MSRRSLARLARAAALALIALAVVFAARGLERHNTWYLASDQFAFLTFADDLTRGTVFRDPGIYATVGRPMDRSGPRDAFYQTYFWEGDRLYSRYPPGFPALLAVAGWVGGEVGRHLLNPLLYMFLLALLPFLVWSLLRAHDRSLAAGSAVAAVWLLLLLPTQIHLWGITVARDLPAHLVALASVLCAIRGRYGGAGLLLGLACSIRPDAALYGVSLAAIAAVDRPRVRGYAGAALGFAVGALPLFLYNAATRGHPFSFTQGGEFTRLLSSLGGDPRLILAQALPMPSGGGFRLAHFSRTLEGNLGTLVRAFSWTAMLAAVGLVWSLRTWPLLAAAFAPYAALAVVFYSFWSHPDVRYLAGVSMGLIALVATGGAVLCRRLADPRTSSFERVSVGLAWLAVACFAWLGADPRRVLAAAGPTLAIGAAVVVAALAGFVAKAARASRAATLLPGLLLAVLGLVRIAGSRGERDPFQRAQVERARASIESLVPEGSLVMVGESLGRPAENITHYTHARALYGSELPLVHSNPAAAVMAVLREGHRVFLLVPSDDVRAAAGAVDSVARLHVVERRTGRPLYDWFVDPAMAPQGAVLLEATAAWWGLGPMEGAPGAGVGE